MKKVEKIPATINKVTWFCDICGKKMAENARWVCTHCGKDICSKHKKWFDKSIDWRSGFEIHGSSRIDITLCDECRKIEMNYEEFIELFFKEMNVCGPSKLL